MLNFKKWLESFDAKRQGIKDNILNFLKDELNIKDDEQILSMPLKSIDSGVVNNLMRRGMLANADEDLLSDIKNGSITVEDLVNRLSKGSNSETGINLNLARKPDQQFTVQNNGV